MSDSNPPRSGGGKGAPSRRRGAPGWGPIGHPLAARPVTLFLLIALPLLAQAEDPLGVFRSRGQIAVRAPIFCTDSTLNDQIRRENLLLTADVPGTGKLPPGQVTSIRAAQPDDLPMELVLLVPRDRTMQNAHDKMMELMGTTGALLASVGHRHHTVRLFTYHACQGETANTPGNVVVEDRGAFPTEGDGPTRLRDAATEIRRAGGLCKPAEFKKVMDAFLAMAAPAPAQPTIQRTRILVVLHDGMEVSPELRDVKSGAPGPAATQLSATLSERFQRVLLVEPDIAPTVLKRYSSRLLQLETVKQHIVGLYVDELEAECISQLGADAPACVAADARTRRKTQAQGLAAAMGQVQLTTGLGETFVSRASLVALAAGAGVRRDSRSWELTAQEVNRVFPRPTGLDCFGAYLAQEGIGALVLFGGIQSNRPACKGFEDRASVASSFADALLRSSPFNGARIAEVCFTGVPGDAAGGAGSVRYDVSVKQPEGNSLRCVSGQLTLPQGTAAAPAADSEGAVAAICRPPTEALAAKPAERTNERQYSLFFVLLVGLMGAGAGAVTTVVRGRRKDD